MKTSVLLLFVTFQCVLIAVPKIAGQKRTPNSIGAITDIINPDDINEHSSIGPILADIVCRLCSDIADKKKRENCIKKFCAGTAKFSTSANIFALSTSSGITKLARSSGISKLARSSGISKLARSSGISKLARSSGISKLARSSGVSKTSTSSGISKSSSSSGISKSSTSSGVSKFSKSSARSSKLRSQINKYVYSGIQNNIRPRYQSKVIISNLTDILCKLCNNLSDKTKERDCAVKYCIRSIGALPFIPLRNKHSLNKVRKPKV